MWPCGQRLYNVLSYLVGYKIKGSSENGEMESLFMKLALLRK